MADVSITTASVIPASGTKLVTVTAGASVTGGQSVYKDTADSSKWKPADADAAASALAGGIACTAAEDEQPFVVCTEGDIAVGTAGAVSIGVSYYVSTNAGGISPAADQGSGDYTTHLGIATTNTTLTLDIDVSGVAQP